MVNKYSGLKAKDIDYVSFIVRHGMVTVKQLALCCETPGLSNYSRVYQRIKKLEKFGYVAKESFFDKFNVYYGKDKAKLVAERSASLPSSLSAYLIQHELMITDILLFRRFWNRRQGRAFDYKTEREIRYQMTIDVPSKQAWKRIKETRDYRPDALIYQEDKNGDMKTIWIELELNLKSLKRYKSKFEYFNDLLDGKETCEGENIDQIIYYCGSDQIESNMKRHRDNLDQLSSENRMKFGITSIPDVVLNERWEEVINGQ